MFGRILWWSHLDFVVGIIESIFFNTYRTIYIFYYLSVLTSFDFQGICSFYLNFPIWLNGFFFYKVLFYVCSICNGIWFLAICASSVSFQRANFQIKNNFFYYVLLLLLFLSFYFFVKINLLQFFRFLKVDTQIISDQSSFFNVCI